MQRQVLRKAAKKIQKRISFLIRKISATSAPLHAISLYSYNKVSRKAAKKIQKIAKRIIKKKSHRLRCDL